MIGRVWLVLLGLVVAAGLWWGVVTLFQLRFESGDTYQPYSTLMAGPKGCRALYEALESVEGEAVSRNLMPLERVEGKGEMTVVRAGYYGNGIYGGTLLESQYTPMKEVLEDGGRLVVALNPQAFRGGSVDGGLGVRVSGNDDDDDVDEMTGERFVELEEEWGLEIESWDPTSVPTDGWETEREGAGEAGPRWLGRWWFDKLDEAWEVVLRADDKPVLVRRPLDGGELVLAGDSYFLSNEGLWVTPAPALIEELLAGRAKTVFDETHLGSVLDPGVVSLIGQYGLQGAVIGAFLVLGLYAWKNGSRLVPADDLAEGRRYADAAVMGAGAAMGFRRLLRRNVGSGVLLSTCYREWFKSTARKRSFTGKRADEVIALIEAEEAKSGKARRTASAYNRIAGIINRRD